MKKLIVLLFALIVVTGTAVAQSEPDYLCFEVTAGTTISIKLSSLKPDIQYSYDKVNWNTLTSITVDTDCKVYFKGINKRGLNDRYDSGDYCTHFEVSKQFKCSGSVMSLVDGTGNSKALPFDNGVNLGYCFGYLFKDCPLTSAPKLPATDLTTACYMAMFMDCKYLTVAPELPATSITSYCYSSMFKGCTSLIEPPALPATILKLGCYCSMFEDCTSLTTAPELTATALRGYCYERMFFGCTNLTDVPRIAATGFQSISNDFSHCLSMFYGCEKLNTVMVDLTSWGYKDSFVCWLGNVAPTGLFVCPKELEDVESHIPTGWKIAHYDDVFTITTSDNYVTINITSVGYDGVINFTVKERYNYKLQKVLVNGKEITITGKSGTINMRDYLEDIEIQAVYLKTNLTINNTSSFSSVESNKADEGDEITVSFTERPGYVLESAAYNNIPLDIENYQASFIMPANNVNITTKYSLKNYNIITDDYITPDKSTATINDAVSFSITDRSSEGYSFKTVLLNDEEFTARWFYMRDYMQDIELKAVYSVNSYTITTDQYSSVDNYSANYGDNIIVTFSNRPGYTIQSASYNGSELSISDYQSTFTMPAADVSITTEYTPISYSVTPYDQFISVDKSSATINDIVYITITDRTADNYTLNHLLVNGNEINFDGYSAQILMSDYLTDVTIRAEYSYTEPSNTTYYSVTNDEYCTVDKSSAAEGDVVTVYINQREGYSVNVYYNGAWLTSDYQASFSMPAEDVYIYAEYTEMNSSQYYNVSTDQYSSTDKTQYAHGETVSVTFSKRDGYNLESATINNTALYLDGYTATFEMPSNDVSIVAEYKKIEKPEEYTVTNTSEYVTVSTTSAKPGDEVTVFVSRRDGYTPHVFVNGAEVLINGNVAKYIQPSASVVITVDYKKNTTTAVNEVSGINPVVSVYPNPARQGEKIVISIDGGIDLKNAKILIYNSYGAIVKRIDHAAEYNETSLKSGVYNGVLIYKNGRQTFRIAVY